MKNEEVLKNIRLILSNSTPESDIFEILCRHRCDELVLRIPTSRYYSKVYLKTIANHACVKERLHICKPLLEQMDIPYVVMKGAALSKAIYGNPYVRTSGDVDLLIDRENLRSMQELLRDNGFIQGKLRDGRIMPATRSEIVFHTAFSHQTVPFIKAVDSALCPFVNVDINTSLFWGESGKKIEIQSILEKRIKNKFDDVTLYKLPPVYELIALCLHHYKDMNSIYLLSQGSLKLRLFLDIYYYIQKNYRELPADILRDTAKEWGALPYVYYCLDLTSDLFPDDLLTSYCCVLENREGEKLKNRYGLLEEEQRVWNVPLVDRLFSPDFLYEFQKSMTEKDRKKIELNVTMMQ